MRKTGFKIDAPEFFNRYVLLAIVLFAANNFWLKAMYGNWLTGKISDFTFCFFFPLYLSALISMISTAEVRIRVMAGALLTLLVFSAVKLSPFCSEFLNSVISPISKIIFQRQSLNSVDISDLIALPFILIAICFGLSRIEPTKESIR